MIYTFNQTSASDTWTVAHNLNGYPISDVIVDYNGGREKILPLSITYSDANTIVVSFSIPVTGSVSLYGQDKSVLNTSTQDSTKSTATTTVTSP